MAGLPGGTRDRNLNRLQYAMANNAAPLGAAAAGDRLLVADASDDYEIKYAVPADLGLFTDIDATADEINVLADVTPGTATASKALVIGASKEIATITSATITTLTSTTVNATTGGITTVNATDVNAGASGTAGTIDIFPTTASKGKIAILAADNTSNDTLTITNAAQSAAATMTIPDTNGSAAFLMTTAAQTISGIKTFSTMPLIPVATVAATGADQTGAAAITTGFTLVTGADDSVGVKLPTAVAGLICIIKVAPGADLKVYPNTSDTINKGAANSAITVVDDVCFALIALDAVDWYTLPLLPS